MSKNVIYDMAAITVLPILSAVRRTKKNKDGTAKIESTIKEYDLNSARPFDLSKIDWKCEKCGAELDRQEGFDPSKRSWKCTGCSRKNDLASVISFYEILNEIAAESVKEKVI